MATAAGCVMAGRERRKLRPRRKPPVVVVHHGGRELGAEEGRALVAAVSSRMRQRAGQRFERSERRLAGEPERLSVRRAMLAVEQRLVEALWTLARLPGERGVGFARRNGLDYTLDREDKWGEAVANGGWLSERPRPSPPSAQAIDAMHEPLDWLRHLDRERARILTLGAQYKRGDMARNIGWRRIRERNPELRDYSARYLARRYHEALRMIVAELTIARAGQMP